MDRHCDGWLMPIASTLIALGVAPPEAEILGFSNLTPVSATGTTQGTAYAIKPYVTQIEVVSATSPTALGVRLPADVEFQLPFFVLNSSAVTISVYPPSGSKIDAGSTNAAATLAAGYSLTFNRIDNTRWSSTVNSSGTNLVGNTVIVTTAGPFTIADNTSAEVLNKFIASATSITLGTVAGRNGLPLVIADVANNAGDITITPNGAETIMGFSSYIMGSGGSMTLYPSTALGGWYKGN